MNAPDVHDLTATETLASGMMNFSVVKLAEAYRTIALQRARIEQLETELADWRKAATAQPPAQG